MLYLRKQVTDKVKGDSGQSKYPSGRDGRDTKFWSDLVCNRPSDNLENSNKNPGNPANPKIQTILRVQTTSEGQYHSWDNEGKI